MKKLSIWSLLWLGISLSMGVMLGQWAYVDNVETVCVANDDAGLEDDYSFEILVHSIHVDMLDVASFSLPDRCPSSLDWHPFFDRPLSPGSVFHAPLRGPPLVG